MSFWNGIDFGEEKGLVKINHSNKGSENPPFYPTVGFGKGKQTLQHTSKNECHVLITLKSVARFSVWCKDSKQRSLGWLKFR